MLGLANFQAQANPDDPSYNEARLEMIAALLHVWYRIQPDLKSMIMAAVREIAIIHDNDVDQAVFSAHQVIDGARDAGSALTEQREAIQKRQAKTRTVREDTKANQLRKRLKSEHMRSA